MDTLDRSHTGTSNNGTDRDTLYLLGGAALIFLGAGLVLSNPTARRFLGQVGLGDLTQLALPDFERYMKMRSM